MPELIDILKALSDKTRFRIISLLLEDRYCVKSIARKLHLTEACISQHIKILKEAGLLKGEKRGYFIHYDVVPDSFYSAIKGLEELIGRIGMRNS